MLLMYYTLFSALDFLYTINFRLQIFMGLQIQERIKGNSICIIGNSKQISYR